MDTDRKILTTAAAMFYEKGFHGVSIDELGSAAGLSGPALYRHFTSKQEILATLFNEAMDELVSATATVDEDPWTDLQRLIRHHVRFAVSNRALVNVYQREDRSLVDPWRREFHRRRQRYVGRWESCIGSCFPSASAVEVGIVTQATLGLIFSLAYWPTCAVSEAGLEALVVGFVNAGLRTLDRPASTRTDGLPPSAP